MKSQEVEQASARAPIHKLFGKALENLRVSSKSIWSDHTWILDSDRVRTDSETSIKWSVSLGNGELLTDPKHARLLDWLRRMVWSLLTAPGDGFKPLSPGTMPSVSIGMGKLVPWLVANHILWPHQMTQPVLDQLLEEIPLIAASDLAQEHMGDEDDDRPRGPVLLILNFVYYLWRQRKALHKAGIAPMPSQPWPDEEGANSIAVKITGRERGWTPPLADEVAIPLLNSAFSFLATPADDIRTLIGMIHEVERRFGSTPIGRWGHIDNKRSGELRKVFGEFRFTELPETSLVWHGPLLETSGKNPMLEVRNLLLDLIAACCISICGTTGLRGSELEQLRAGVDPQTGLPTGVDIKKSSTGMNEEFILVSGMPKGSAHPRSMEWTLGSRRLGDVEEPLALQAMRVLDTLLKPYRDKLKSNRLILFISSKSAVVETRKATELDSAKLKKLYAHFIQRQVDLSRLPDSSRLAVTPNDLVAWRESKGAIIRPGALRKTFASYVLSTSPELLPAVKRQFQHMNMAMTEGGYWGMSLKQVEPISSVSRQMTASMLYNLTQNGAVGGKMGKQISENLEPLRLLVKDLTPGHAWRRMVQWVESNDLHVNHGAHGDCVPVTASRMDCWKQSGQRPMGSLVPNFETRNVSMCTGCSCFLMNERHVPFWRDRLRDHEATLESAEDKSVLDGSFREVARRANQAKNVLRSLGAIDSVGQKQWKEK